MKTRNLLNFVAYLTLILMFGTIILVSFWLIYPYKPITFANTPFPVDKKVYITGESLFYEVDYCKYTDVNPMVTRYFVNGISYLMSSNLATPKLHGCSTTKVQIIIPESLAPDTYSLKIIYSYQINPIRTVEVVNTTQNFTIK